MKTVFATLGSRFSQWADRTDPVRLVVLGYLSYVFIGWILLCLPLSQQARGVAALDHLFMAMSAVTTTGLVTVSVADTYNAFGEVIVLLLIQVGGLGYMTIGSFLVMALSGGLSPLRERLGGTTLSLPAGFEVKSFLKLMVLFTLVIEALGAVALYYGVFAPRGLPQPAWQALFHSVSAFCTAGFSLFNDSFESYRGDVKLNGIIAILSYLGAIGFIVVADAWHSLARRRVRVTLTTKIILLSTLWITVAGTALFFLDEPAVRELPTTERWVTSFFQVMTASTTVGFNTLPIGALSASSLFLLMLVMFIGASPAGTGGGLKTTTFTAVWAVMMAVIRRRRDPTFLGREIPEARVRMAVASLLFYGGTLSAGVYALSLVETAPLAEQMFECVSALGTVGLSRGLTSELNEWGKAIVLTLMFVGRVGPVVLGMALFRAPPLTVVEVKCPEEDVAI